MIKPDEDSTMSEFPVVQLRVDAKRDRQRIREDYALAKQAASGDRDAFRQIVECNKQRMFSIAHSIVPDPDQAEDVVQEAFIKAYRSLPRFRGNAQLSTWLFRITTLAAIDQRRTNLRKRETSLGATEQTELVDHSMQGRSETAVVSREARRDLDQALTSLTDLEQAVFTLRHRQNLKLREIAQVLERSEGTVKNILFRAIRKMRDRLIDAEVCGEMKSGFSLPGIDKC